MILIIINVFTIIFNEVPYRYPLSDTKHCYFVRVIMLLNDVISLEALLNDIAFVSFFFSQSVDN